MVNNKVLQKTPRHPTLTWVAPSAAKKPDHLERYVEVRPFASMAKFVRSESKLVHSRQFQRAEPQCKGTTKAGKRCKKNTCNDDGYCMPEHRPHAHVVSPGGDHGHTSESEDGESKDGEFSDGDEVTITREGKFKNLTGQIAYETPKGFMVRVDGQVEFFYARDLHIGGGGGGGGGGGTIPETPAERKEREKREERKRKEEEELERKREELERKREERERKREAEKEERQRLAEEQKAVERENARKNFMKKLGTDLHRQLQRITNEKIRTMFGSDETAYIKTMVSKKDLNAANYLGLRNYVKKDTIMFKALTNIHDIIKTIWDKKNAFNEEYADFFSEVFGAGGFNTKPCFWYNGLNRFTSAFWDFYCTDNAGIDVEYVQKYIEHAQAVCDIATQGRSSIDFASQIANATEAERRRVEEADAERRLEEERQRAERLAEEKRQRVEKLAEEERQRLAEEKRRRLAEEKRQRVEKLAEEERRRKKIQILQALQKLREAMKGSRSTANDKRREILKERRAEVKHVMNDIIEGSQDLDSEEITRQFFENKYKNEDNDDFELSDDEIKLSSSSSSSSSSLGEEEEEDVSEVVVVRERTLDQRLEDGSVDAIPISDEDNSESSSTSESSEVKNKKGKGKNKKKTQVKKEKK